MTITSSPARIGLVKIHGAVGFGIKLGQWFNGDGFIDWSHAFMDLGDGTVIEAEPGGARIVPLSEYDHAKVYWCDGIYSQVSPLLRGRIADEARKLKGTPYSFLDYDAIAAHRLGLDTRFLQRYIEDTGHLICSQLVDLAYERGGFKIFTDGRWDGFVTPGDIYLRDRQEVAKPNTTMIYTYDPAWRMA